MAGLIGIAPTPRAFGAANPMLSIELNALGEGTFAPAAYRREGIVAWAAAFRAPAALRWPATGRLAHRFAEDLFDRVHVLPTALRLGNVVSELTREVAVWNAWRTIPQTLTSLRLEGDAGSTLVASAPLPLLAAMNTRQVAEVPTTSPRNDPLHHRPVPPICGIEDTPQLRCWWRSTL